MKIGYDAKRYYHNHTGLGNYSRTLVAAVTGQCPDIVSCLYDEKSIKRTFKLGRIAKNDGCDLFHGLSNELPFDIQKSGIPSIVTIHDVAWRTFPGMYKPIDRLIYDWKYGHSAKIATHVIAISESTKRDIMRFYDVPEQNITVIYQPVQKQFYTPMPKEKAAAEMKKILPWYTHDTPFLLTVGSINSRKNLLGMLQAYNALPKEKQLPFIVIGNGREYRKKCEQYISENSLTEKVTILDNIHDGGVLQALYTCSTILLYPSFYEGFGLPVVEAALQGCPVITSNVSSLPEAAGDGAILVDPYSIPQLTAAIERLLDNPDERKALGSKARDYANNSFNPEKLTKQLIELYESVRLRG